MKRRWKRFDCQDLWRSQSSKTAETAKNGMNTVMLYVMLYDSELSLSWFTERMKSRLSTDHRVRNSKVITVIYGRNFCCYSVYYAILRHDNETRVRRTHSSSSLRIPRGRKALAKTGRSSLGSALRCWSCRWAALFVFQTNGSRYMHVFQTNGSRCFKPTAHDVNDLPQRGHYKYLITRYRLINHDRKCCSSVKHGLIAWKRISMSARFDWGIDEYG